MNNNNYCVAKTSDDKDLIKVIESKVIENKNGQQSTSMHPSIVALTAACSEKILNPEYLLQGGGSPFVGEVKNGNGNGVGPGTSKKEPEEKPAVAEKEKPVEPPEPTKPTVILQSYKMRGLKDLLLAEKLNTHAISLQLTAQSQVGKKGRTDHENTRPKRNRRE